MTALRLLPFTRQAGADNMAADEALLHSAATGLASLRFYGWTEATVSLGYFQPTAVRLGTPLLAGLPYVRRPTGGGTLVHHYELTYALALPATLRRLPAESWLFRMHRIIMTTLIRLGVPCMLAPAANDERAALCFHNVTPGDVLCGTGKIVGSAQRKHRHGFLQHGGILLARSPFTPSLPGIRELCGKQLDIDELCAAVVQEFTLQTGWDSNAAHWTAAELTAIESLAGNKYAGKSWNDKR